MATLSGYNAYYREGYYTADNFYKPAMMQYDGTTNYYTSTVTMPTSNKQTVVLRFSCSGPLVTNRILAYQLKSAGAVSLLVSIVESDDANGNANTLRVRVNNSSSATVCQFYTSYTVTDGEIYNVFFDYDGDNGTATFIVNGVDADNTGATGRVAPTTGTLDSGATSYFSVGSVFNGTTLGECNIGFCGYSRTAGLTWSDFQDTSGNPIKQDESTWASSGWGAQPLFWNEHGQMIDNKGSLGDMTGNGTFLIAPAEVTVP